MPTTITGVDPLADATLSIICPDDSEPVMAADLAVAVETLLDNDAHFQAGLNRFNPQSSSNYSIGESLTVNSTTLSNFGVSVLADVDAQIGYTYIVFATGHADMADDAGSGGSAAGGGEIRLYVSENGGAYAHVPGTISLFQATAANFPFMMVARFNVATAGTLLFALFGASNLAADKIILKTHHILALHAKAS